MSLYTHNPLHNKKHYTQPSSLQGTPLETYQSKKTRFLTGKFMTLDGTTFYNVPKLWEKTKNNPAAPLSVENTFKSHKNDIPWSTGISLKNIVEQLTKIKGNQDWTDDETFKAIDYEKDILPKLNLKALPLNQNEKNELNRRLKSVFNANINYPIIITPSKKILDGNHRLLQAKIRELTTIQAKTLTQPPNKDDIQFNQGEWKRLLQTLKSK